MSDLFGLDLDEVGLEVSGVYCIKARDHGFWKVGVTKDVTKRLRSLDESAPFAIEVAFFVSWDEKRLEPLPAPLRPVGPQDARLLERWIHRGLVDWSSHREWFFVPPDQEDTFLMVLSWVSEWRTQKFFFGQGWAGRITRHWSRR